ncbi:DUF3105 domain-containing protein [Cellulomonas phragmiteti]|uniref:DUF3105 domain-containing protein n=1 Tax=Cellulomonas phragmiteti TaxID=478780 RepID=A0ABQ4DH76_9CELL|nr:DUF3105 domain-containing protein [Cellulomonas phragmiteti]GIG38377.1 hypothetical protein Cph01nite_01390 [Cellulomonas phragmiteti]
MSKTSQRDERAARLAAVQAEQRRTARRRTAIVVGVVGTLVVALVAVTSVVLVGEARRASQLEAQAAAEIEGVESFEDLSFDHVSTEVDYPQTPPVGGEHNAVWQNCGVYSDPVVDEHAVHSLEHGAVWITYDPELPADQVATLRAFAEGQPYVLVSPYPGVPSPVVASAWGYQLQLDDADDERLPVFLRKYLLNPELPEAGALCSNGVGTPA